MECKGRIGYFSECNLISRLKNTRGLKMKRKAFMGIALTLTAAQAWADGPTSAYENGAPVQSTLDPGEYVVNADGAKEDLNHRLSDIARAYRNGLINGRAEQKNADAKIKPPLPAGMPPGLPHGIAEDDNAKWTSIPPQPQGYQPPPPPRYRPVQYAQTPQYAEVPVAVPEPTDYEPTQPQVIVRQFIQVSPRPPQPQHLIVTYVQQQPYVQPPPYDYVDTPPPYGYADIPPPPPAPVVQPVISIAVPVYRDGYWNQSDR
jgi:hypothetical protein